MLNHSLSSYLVPNLYDPNTYFRLDNGPGRIENRSGTKIVTLSTTMLRGLYLGLKKETGPAWTLIMKSCGDSWGKRYVSRLFAEAEEFYGQSIGEMKIARFTTLVREALAVHGWGRLELDFSFLPQGVIVANLENPATSAALHDVDDTQVDVVIAGILKAIFSQAAGQQLECHQTERLTGEAPLSRFVVAMEKRMEGVPQMIENRSSHDEILEAVVNTVV